MNLSLVKSLFKNRIFWYLFSRYFSLALQFLSSIFIALKLGVYHFGIWSFMLLLINIGSSCNWGIGNAATILLVQHKDDEKLCRSYVLNSLILVLLTALIPVAVTVYDRAIGIPFFEKYHLGNLIYAAGGVVILQYLCNFFVNIYRVKNRIMEIIIQQSLWPLIMTCLIFCSSGEKLLNLLAVGYIAALSVAVAVFTAFFHFRGSRSDVSITRSREIISKGFFLFLYNACFLAIMLSTKFLISYYYSVAEFGYFSFAFSLAQGVVLLIDSLIFLVFPKMIDMLKGNDVEQIRSAIKVLRENYLLPLHLLFYIILVISVPFFHFMPQYSKSFLPFVLILFTLVIYSNCFGYNSYLLAQNREKSFSLIVLTALCFNILLVWALVRFVQVQFEYGILATLLVYFLYSIAVNSYALYLTGVRNWRVYFRENLFSRANLIYIACLGALMHWGCSWLLFFTSFILFLMLHIKQIRQLAGNAVKLIRNDRLINV